MKRMQMICGNCAGFGHYTRYKVVSESEARAEETVCDVCGGKGHIEYAVFSIEEAETILRHCGLSVEGD